MWHYYVNTQKRQIDAIHMIHNVREMQIIFCFS